MWICLRTLNPYLAVAVNFVQAHCCRCDKFHSGTVIKLIPPCQNGRHFADISKCIFMSDNIWISFDILLTFLKGPIDNKSALVQALAWRRTGDKPLPEPRLTYLTDAYMWHSGEIGLTPYLVTSIDLAVKRLVAYWIQTIKTITWTNVNLLLKFRRKKLLKLKSKYISFWKCIW